MPLRTALSDPRLGPYDAATSHDPVKAVQLYLWNLDLSAAFYDLLSIAEVALRNAMHDQLSARFGANWYTRRDLFDDRTARAFSTAWKQLRLPSATSVTMVPPGKFVGELTFGAWVFLLDAGGWNGHDPMRTRCDYENTLWRPCLHSAFPNNARGTRRPVHILARRVQAVRNRVAHHEPLIWGVPDPQVPGVRTRLADAHAQVLELVGLIDASVHAWLTAASRVPGLLVVPPAGATGLLL